MRLHAAPLVLSIQLGQTLLKQQRLGLHRFESQRALLSSVHDLGWIAKLTDNDFRELAGVLSNISNPSY